MKHQIVLKAEIDGDDTETLELAKDIAVVAITASSNLSQTRNALIIAAQCVVITLDKQTKEVKS